jgi:hypothetical protein
MDLGEEISLLPMKQAINMKNFVELAISRGVLMEEKDVPTAMEMAGGAISLMQRLRR